MSSIDINPWVTIHFYRATVSANHAQWTRKMKSKRNPKKEVFRRVDTTDMRNYKNYVMERALEQVKFVASTNLLYLKESRALECQYVFIDRFMQKRKHDEPLKKDVTNLLKATEDAIFKAVGLDDRLVFKSSIEKVHCDNEEDARFILRIRRLESPTKVSILWRPL